MGSAGFVVDVQQQTSRRRAFPASASSPEATAGADPLLEDSFSASTTAAVAVVSSASATGSSRFTSSTWSSCSLEAAAATLFWPAMWPRTTQDDQRTAIISALGPTVLAKEGVYFLSKTASRWVKCFIAVVFDCFLGCSFGFCLFVPTLISRI